MDYDKIKYTVYSVYEKCNITRLPFDCTDILSKLGYLCTKYSQLPNNKLNACLKLSPDACTLGNNIYYNDKKSIRRVRFSLMHELGHIELNTNLESEANLFSSIILVPPIALHYSKLCNVREISNLFNISLECAKYARDYHEKWLYNIKHYGMTIIDRKMYQHFYSQDSERFVFKETCCAYCDHVIYNTNKPICNNCEHNNSDFSIINSQTDDFIIAENSWLYKDL